MSIPFLTNGWNKSQMVIRFSDADPDANNNYHFVFQTPIAGVVYADWISASEGLTNKAIYINELVNDGQTTSKITPITPPSSSTITPYDTSAEYEVGATVSFGPGLYSLTYSLTTIADGTPGGESWGEFTATDYEPTTSYKLFDVVYGQVLAPSSEEGPPVYYVQAFILTNPSSYPGPQPVPGSDDTWTIFTPANYSSTDLYTAGVEGKVAGSVVTFAGGGSSFYQLQPDGQAVPAVQPLPTSANWAYQGAYKPNPNIRALPTSSSQTTTFWRFINAPLNMSTPNAGEVLGNRKELTFLNVKVLKLDGTSITPTADDFLQISFWSKV